MVLLLVFAKIILVSACCRCVLVLLLAVSLAPRSSTAWSFRLSKTLGSKALLVLLVLDDGKKFWTRTSRCLQPKEEEEEERPAVDFF
jgi:hypothetical protein